MPFGAAPQLRAVTSPPQIKMKEVNEMKNYVLASHDFETHTVNYLQSIGDRYSFGPVNTAMRFDKQEILDLLANDDNLSYLGFSVIRIEDCTFEILKVREELVRDYSRLDYAIR